MEIHQLRYFLAVAETGNFTRASERSHISQPSLSQQIINLEKELGQKLFHRLGRKAVLTDSGQRFMEHANRIIYEVETATKEIKDNPDAERRITIGAIPTVMPYLIPLVIEETRRKHHNLIIHALEDFRTPLVKSVIEGDLDMAIVTMPVTDPRVLVEPLFSEQLLLAVPKEHPLATKDSVSGGDLKDETFVLLGHSSSLAAQIQEFCGAHDFDPRIGYRCSQVRTVKTFVSMGLGISILPPVARTLDDGKIVYRHLSGRIPERKMALVRHPQRYQSWGAARFLGVLRECVSAHPDIHSLVPKA